MMPCTLRGGSAQKESGPYSRRKSVLFGASNEDVARELAQRAVEQVPAAEVHVERAFVWSPPSTSAAHFEAREIRPHISQPETGITFPARHLLVAAVPPRKLDRRPRRFPA